MHRRRTPAGLALALAVVAGIVASPAGVTADASAATRPNIVLITTDDMNASDLAWMPITQSLLEQAGVSVQDFLSNHPLCCPARAQILTGQYAHNNGVHSNSHPEFGGFAALRSPREHLGTWLQRAGYRTAFVGKYLNGWEARPTLQPGWTIFNPILRRTYSAYGMTMYRHGSPRVYEGVHTADLMGRLGARYVTRFAAEGHPFFVWVSQVPPHGMQVKGTWRPPVAAARHRGLFATTVAPSVGDPSFDEADVSDKPGWVSEQPPVDVDRINRLHIARVRSLQAVDEQVGRLVRALDEQGVLERTYIMFTSDNGYLLGEHRLRGKNTPYEPNLRVPLLVRGPGLPAGVVRPQTYGMVDLAPTLLDVAGATPGRVLDGLSMLPTLQTGAAGYDRYLIQAGTQTLQWWWRGVRSRDWTYVRYADGGEELYDRVADPFQLRNLATDPRYAKVLKQSEARLDALQDCAGEACQRFETAEPVSPSAP